MKKKTVLAFDFDGTIGNSVKLERYTMYQAIKKFANPAFTEQDIIKYYGPTEKGIIAKFVDEKSFKEAWSYFLNVYKEQSKILLKEPFPGMRDLLKKYSSQKNLLVVMLTGRSQETLDISLKDLGLSQYFVKNYTGAMDKSNKEESIVKLLHDYGLNKDDVIYIGDTIADVKMMRNVSVDIISATYGYPNNRCEEIEKANPGLIAHTVKELDELIAKVTKQNIYWPNPILL